MVCILRVYDHLLTTNLTYGVVMKAVAEDFGSLLILTSSAVLFFSVGSYVFLAEAKKAASKLVVLMAAVASSALTASTASLVKRHFLIGHFRSRVTDSVHANYPSSRY